jgi:tetratricopeptide (TPR) repeat protein
MLARIVLRIVVVLGGVIGIASGGLIGCGGKKPVVMAKPTATVKSEIDLAEAAERKRRHDVARVHYERAIAIATDPPSAAFARHKFGETLATWGEYREALAQLEQSVQAVGDNAIAWHDVGIVRHKLEDVPGAIAALERSRALAPEEVQPRVSLGVIRWKSGDLAGAKKEYEELLELELPDRLRTKVKWAIDQLTARLAKP